MATRDHHTGVSQTRMAAPALLSFLPILQPQEVRSLGQQYLLGTQNKVNKRDSHASLTEAGGEGKTLRLYTRLESLTIPWDGPSINWGSLNYLSDKQDCGCCLSFYSGTGEGFAHTVNLK